MIRAIFLIGIVLFSVQIIYSQNSTSWKRGSETGELDLQLFRSTQAINLPTAETMQTGGLFLL